MENGKLKMKDNIVMGKSYAFALKKITFLKIILKCKMNNFQFSIFHFQFIVFLFAVGCHSAPDALPSLNLSQTGNAALDSLLQIAATAPQDTNLARLYYEIGDRFEDVDVEKAKTFYLNVENLSERIGWYEGSYLSSYAFGNLLIREGQPDAAVEVFQKGYDLAVRENNEIWKANMVFAKGNAYSMKQSHEQALTLYMEALPIYEKTNDIDKIQHLYYMITQSYLFANDIEKAFEYGEKSVALNRENPYSFLCLAIAYQAAQQREKSIAYYEEVLRLATLQNNVYLMVAMYGHLANDALVVLDLERAERYAQLAMKHKRIVGPASISSMLILLSKVEELKGNTAKSEEYANEMQQIAAKFDLLNEKKLACMMLSELTLAHRQYGKKSQYYVEWDLFDFAMLTDPTVRSAEDMLQKYELSQKELEIEQQQQIIALQNRQRWFLAAGIAICMIFLALLWYMFRSRTRALTERNNALTQRNEALAEINLTKDKFFSIISHDMRNPIVAQRDALQLLVEHGRLWDVDRVTAYYHELLKSADGQVELIYNLLGWAQLQTGRLTCHPTTFLFADLLNDLTLVRKMAENKGITFTAQIPPAALVTCDSNMMATIVRNLLNNAVKFTAAGGTVTLDISPCRDVECHVSTNNETRHVSTNSGYIVSVADTGVGMSHRQINNLFCLKTEKTRKGTSGEQGSGLGLIVCREFLEKHGSELYVESKAGKGTRFWFELRNSLNEI